MLPGTEVRSRKPPTGGQLGFKPHGLLGQAAEQILEPAVDLVEAADGLGEHQDAVPGHRADVRVGAEG